MSQPRFHIDKMHDDESTSSVLDRVAAGHRIPCVQKIVVDLCPDLKDGPAADIDRHWNKRLRESFAEALGVDHTSMQDLPDRCLSPNARHAYCPRCFYEDLEQRQTPYFRWHWSIPLVSFCAHHDVPLFQWKRTQWRRRVLPYSWTRSPWIGQVSLCPFLKSDLAMIDTIETQPLRAAFALNLVRRFQRDMVDQSNREDWVRDEHAMLSLFEPVLGACVDILRHSEDPSDQLIPIGPRSRELFAKGNRGLHSYKRGSSYSSFSKLKDVAWRRSILWAASTIIYNEQLEWSLQWKPQTPHPSSRNGLSLLNGAIITDPYVLLDNIRFNAHRDRYRLGLRARSKG